MLETERLILRPFQRSDAERVAALAGDREIVLNTLSIPHPYTIEDAQQWIARQQESRSSGDAVELAITIRDSGEVAGAIGLMLSDEKRRAELGYWLGREYWGRGLVSEASRELVRYGFHSLGLQRVFAFHFARNQASRRVLERLGMSHEGILRKHVSKWGEPQDLWVWGILRHEFESPAKTGE